MCLTAERLAMRPQGGPTQPSPKGDGIPSMASALCSARHLSLSSAMGGAGSQPLADAVTNARLSPADNLPTGDASVLISKSALLSMWMTKMMPIATSRDSPTFMPIHQFLLEWWWAQYASRPMTRNLHRPTVEPSSSALNSAH